MKYKDDLGKIIIIRNLTLMGGDGKLHLDYAYRKGRPCVIIGELDDYYVVPLTTKTYKPPFSNYYVPIYLPNHEITYADSKTIIKHNIFYANPIGILETNTYYQLLCKILECDRIATPESFEEIYTELVCQKEDMEKTYSYHF